jgi:hypothetical protein
MEPQTKAGRSLVLAVIVATVTLSVLSIVAFNMVRGSERLPQQIARLVLTLGLCVFHYRGANWARWAAGILFAMGGVASLLGVVALSTSMAGLLLLVMGSVYGACAAVLLFVPTVRAYFGAASAKAG